MIQPGFFDFEDRLCKIDKQGDPLSKIDAAVDWEIFRPIPLLSHKNVNEIE